MEVGGGFAAFVGTNDLKGAIFVFYRKIRNHTSRKRSGDSVKHPVPDLVLTHKNILTLFQEFSDILNLRALARRIGIEPRIHHRFGVNPELDALIADTLQPGVGDLFIYAENPSDKIPSLMGAVCDISGRRDESPLKIRAFHREGIVGGVVV